MTKIKRNKDICNKCGLLRYAKKVSSGFNYSYSNRNKYGHWDECRPEEAEIIVCGYTGLILWFHDKKFKINEDVMKQCKMRLEQIVHQ